MTRTLGMTVRGPAAGEHSSGETRETGDPVNTRHSLWGSRWPAIALQSCIDAVEAAPVALQPQVRRDLPCSVCPENTRCLNAKRKEVGPLLFDREINTWPRSSESSLFPRSLMSPMLDPGYECLTHYRKPEGMRDRYLVVNGWDLAWSEKVGGDWIVRTTAVADRRTGHRRVLDVERHQRLTYPEQTRLIEADHGRFSADLTVLEGDAMQKVYRQSLVESSGIEVLSHLAAGEKRDLRTGVPGMLIDFANRRWTFPHRREGRGYDVIETMLDEFEAFGWQDGKLEGAGEHDDCVMSFWHTWWGLRLLLGHPEEMASGLGTPTGGPR